MTKIQNTSLQNSIITNYKEWASVWNGSTADAIRYQKITGIFVEWRDHIQPWIERRTRLINLINGIQGIPPLTDTEKIIAQSIIDDITTALNVY